MQSRLFKTEKLVVRTAIVAVMASLVAAATLLVRIPNAMGGYFNLGDVAVFAVALTFGPLVGGLAGGIGSAVADLIGFPVFFFPTLIIKGLEGLIAGLITNRKSISRDVAGIVIGGCEMTLGYFLVELYVLQWGLGGAAWEILGNVIQVIVGGVIGIPVAYVVRRRLPEILR